MKAKEIILTFCCLNLAYARPQFQWSVNSFWKDAKPGELLRSLDAITSTAQHLTQEAAHIEDEDIKNSFPKQSANNFRLKKQIDEVLPGSLEEKMPYDYDKAYEEFVKKYFEDSVTDAFSASDSTEHMQHESEDSSDQEMFSGEDHEPVREGSKTSVKLEKCKSIVRDQQNCLVCKNSNNRESSEICSYKKEIKPTGYEFKKKNNYRKYRTTPKKKTNEGFSEHMSKARANTLLKKHKKSKKNIQI